MKKVAVCLYGLVPDEETLFNVEAKIRKKLSAYDLTIFCSFTELDTDIYYSLYKCNFLKSDYEIENSMSFDICVAINVIDFLSIAFWFHINNMPEQNKIYYFKGGYNAPIWTTFADPRAFYARSLEFDRACEFCSSINSIQINRCRGSEVVDFDASYLFYYHNKSMMLKMECVNFENSNLFKRTA